MTRPIHDCYWVIPGQFLAGEYPGDFDQDSAARKIRSFESEGFTLFVNLTEEGELIPYDHLLEKAAHARFPIVDVSVPHSPDHTKSILDAIDRALDEGGKIYVHCMGGIGRTGVIVGCWLARHGYPGAAALDRLEELWLKCPKSAYWDSPQTIEQEDYILEWSEDR